jgi:hypothetical protein
MRLVGTTKTTLLAVRNRTHWNSAALTPMDPVTLGLCSQIDLDFEVNRAAKERVPTEPDHTQTLVPAEITTAPHEDDREEEERVFGQSSYPVESDEQPDIDVDSVFAKLKDLKVKE